MEELDGQESEEAAEGKEELEDSAEALIESTLPGGCTRHCHLDRYGELGEEVERTEEASIAHWVEVGREGGRNCACVDDDGAMGDENDEDEDGDGDSSTVEEGGEGRNNQTITEYGAEEEAQSEETEIVDDEEDADQQSNSSNEGGLTDEFIEDGTEEEEPESPAAIDKGGETNSTETVDDEDILATGWEPIDEVIPGIGDIEGELVGLEAQEGRGAEQLIGETFPPGCTWEGFFARYSDVADGEERTEEVSIAHWIQVGEGDEKVEGTESSAADSHDVKLTPFTLFRYVASIGMLIFSIIIVGALMFTGNTRVAKETNPWVALIVCILAIVWLSMIEGQQASLVGLPPVDPNLYKDSHPITYKNVALAFRGDNLDRYLLGRQFMVLLVVFVINQCSSPLDPTVDVLGFPDGVKFVFLDIGLAMIVFTCILGQLTTQVNASHMMIDYINSYFALFTLYFCMMVEFSGVMHSSYLIQNILYAISGKPIISNEPPRAGFTFAFFWGRVLMSLAILGFCLAVTLSALINGQTSVSVKYPGIPRGLAVVLLFVFMAIVGMLEGMQIAFFAVAKLPASERGTSFFGRKTCDLLFRGNGQNLPGFMIGRQLTVVCSFFLVGSFTSLAVEPGTGNNIFDVSDKAQKFLNWGFQGAVVTTILASISWQLAAAAYPIAFVNNPFTYILLVVALFLEFTGLCSGAWVLARVQKWARGFQYDEVYIGTPGERTERTANDRADEEMAVWQDVGYLSGGGFDGHLAGSHDVLDGHIRTKDTIDADA